MPFVIVGAPVLLLVLLLGVAAVVCRCLDAWRWAAGVFVGAMVGALAGYAAACAGMVTVGAAVLRALHGARPESAPISGTLCLGMVALVCVLAGALGGGAWVYRRRKRACA